MGRKSNRAKAHETFARPVARPSAPTTSSGQSVTLIVLLVALALCAIAYSNSFHNAFVYDDTKQILRNPLVQERHLFWTAMTSDVWAFSGDKGKNWSNYWRPLWIAWVSLNYASFGTNPVGWHLANFFLHALATALGFALLRALGAHPAACAIATWLFAAHPAHVESVTWISGSADPMVASFLFGAMMLHRKGAEHGGALARAAAAGLFGAALLTKEIAVVFIGIVFVTELVANDPWAWGQIPKRLGSALARTVPYFAVTAVYIAVRIGIVGMKLIHAPGAPGFDGVIFSAPAVLLFYLGHTLVPFGLGPSYPLHAVTAANLSLMNFGLPLFVVGVLGYGVWRLWRRDGLYRQTLLWFLMPLAPVFDVRTFLPEDFVHDRYLYLPSFGLLAFASMALVEGWRRASKTWAQGNELTPAWALGVPIAVVLALATRSYNPAWASEIALWERGVANNPDTAFPHAQLGDVYRQAGRLTEARRELSRALELNPGITSAHVSLAALDIRENRLTDAVSGLTRVLDHYPDQPVAIEQLGLAYQKLGRLNDAIALYERGRRAVPYRWANYTVNLAVLHKMSNDSEQATKELESLGDALRTTKDTDVMRAWTYLGDLYREQGRAEAAIGAYEAYLSATASLDSPEIRMLRKSAGESIAALRTGSSRS